MLYSRMAEHAITALGAVERQGSPNFVSTGSIAQETSVPRPILTKVIAGLARAGLLRTREGRHGGVRLIRSADEIRLREVVEAFDEPEILPACPLRQEGCDCGGKTPCSLHARWQDVLAATDRFLDETTVADVAHALGKQA